MPETTATIWNRLESRPRSSNLDRALRCEVRDPLWMLTRQWQFGEFQAEDNGSPILTKVKYQSAPIHKYSLRGQKAANFDADFPLEATIEKQVVDLDLSLRIEMGRYWFRLLRGTLSSTLAKNIIKEFKANKDLHFVLPPEDDDDAQYNAAQILSNSKQLNLLSTVANGRLIDGGHLYEYLTTGSNKKASDLISSSNAQVNDLGKTFIEWFNSVYAQPDGPKDTAWHPSHMEYQFDVSVSDENLNGKVLHTEEYYHGRLDWYNFDFAGQKDKPHNTLGQGIKKSDFSRDELTMLPTEVNFPGMPNARWWQIEDGTVNFGNLKPDTTDISKLIVSEFGLIYGNDWMMVPLSVESGSLSQVDHIEVTDVFGQRTIVKHVNENTPDEFWSFFQVYDRDNDDNKQNERSLLLPPVVHHTLEGPPLEQIKLARDEMANMVWAVETIVPNELGEGMDGHEAAMHLQAFYKNLAGEEDIVLFENKSEWKYNLASTVPENWIPFIPVKLKDPNLNLSLNKTRQIQLQRAAMPRVLSNFPTRRIRPRTSILKEGMDSQTVKPFYLFEEEVPRSGAIISLNWQRTRWYNGKTVVWQGRKKTNGRGESYSNLRFDFINGKKEK